MPLTLRRHLAGGSCGHLPFKRLIDGAIFTHHRRTKNHFFACGAGRGAFIGSASERETLTDPPVKYTLLLRYKSVKVRLKHG